VPVPTAVTVLTDEDIVYVSAAGDISAVVTSDGKIYTWGRTKVRRTSLLMFDRVVAYSRTRTFKELLL
jgi:alpha-tubulin suppressor-like RCC1 family protein